MDHFTHEMNRAVARWSLVGRRGAAGDAFRNDLIARRRRDDEAMELTKDGQTSNPTQFKVRLPTLILWPRA